MRVSTSVSRREFRGEKLVENIREALQDNGLDGDYLRLELSEHEIMDLRETPSVLAEIERLGVGLSIDDFGTGASSLSCLKRLPLDEIKIDRSFIAGLPEDEDDCAIVSAIIAMAHNLGLAVVAEGVESEEQLAFLEERGCDVYQGALFSPPVPPADWLALFEKADDDR